MSDFTAYGNILTSNTAVHIALNVRSMYEETVNVSAKLQPYMQPKIAA
jgi:hypothetical protein